MGNISETDLPGIGVRYEFELRSGGRVGVLVYRTGRREVFVYEARDPDACVSTMELSEDDSRTLAELLGGSRVAERLIQAGHEIAGLAIDWIAIEENSEWAGRTLRDADVHTETGVSVVALVRGDDAIPAPRASQELTAGWTAVAVGTSDGLRELAAKLARS